MPETRVATAPNSNTTDSRNAEDGKKKTPSRRLVETSKPSFPIVESKQDSNTMVMIHHQNENIDENIIGQTSGSSWWQEISLLHDDVDVDNDKEHLSLGQRVGSGRSLIVLHPHHDDDDDTLEDEGKRQWLVSACLDFCDDTEPTDWETAGRRRLVTVAAADRAAGNRTECGPPLPHDADDAVETLFTRVLTRIDDEVPSLSRDLFGTDRLVGLHHHARHDDGDDDDDDEPDQQLDYASREPAVNVYRDGGSFGAHEDERTLTVLMALSHPDEDYRGGGTAFWKKKTKKNNKTVKSGGDGSAPIVIRPPAGTVLLFGGSVTHAALPVTAGCRVVVVASFSRRPLSDDEDE